MIDSNGKTIDEVFREAAARWPDADFVVAPQTAATPVRSFSFLDMARGVDACTQALARAGYGRGQRVAVLLGATPEHYVVKLALNRLGLSCVPVNPDYRAGELAYLLEDSSAVLAISDARHAEAMKEGIAAAMTTPRFVLFDDILDTLPAAPYPPNRGGITPEDEASLLYTSGTTGKPKGCILSHDYELSVGQTYVDIPGLISLREGQDRILNPLPAFHINAGIMTFLAAMLTGNALIQPERFSAKTWWRDVQDTGATVFHYLGVVISVLLADPDAGPDEIGALRAGLGAGVDPSLHGVFEERFGIPLVEAWGMTEMCRVLFIAEEPRQIDTRAMGRPRADLACKVMGDDGREAPRGTPGELWIRHSADTPRKGFFSGYLNKPDATREVWEHGWFHTGDTVTMDDSSMIYFVDRSKNIIRRAGENIAAAEVENVLFDDNRIVNVACIAVPDDMREEEVMACVVLGEDVVPDEATARAIFDRAFGQMAYFKPPGWIRFMEALPVTGTQKVVKHKIFAEGADPLEQAFDFRSLKKRG
ncbi:AMP-binding protein [Aliiroseovarius subalbicans]|uniref:AMP-binding protein n=1 Tax=Aliiroseovarius subalbicans TaxID=2925840 RepID=UPI001F5A2527|nr:AMP-binding protein [Aliiroseovarius subalbicans]MCI2398410.1 AMP-binding protein [Aliiroseovarius subalbicans]